MGVSFVAFVSFCEFLVLRCTFASLREIFVFLMPLGGALLVLDGFGHMPGSVLELTQQFLRLRRPHQSFAH